MEAVILAGGLGTRLCQVVEGLPKVLAPIRQTPFLDIVLDDLKCKGIDHVVLAVSYLKEKIIEHIESQNFPLRIDFSIEEQPLGTGGAIKQALSLCDDENVFVVNGDTFFDVDLISMAKFHKAHDAAITIATKKMRNFERYGTLKIDNDFIIYIQEKKACGEGYISGGIYYLRRDIILDIPQKKFSMEKDFLEKSYKQFKVCAFISDGYFIDIGIPEDYERANRELLTYGKFK